MVTMVVLFMVIMAGAVFVYDAVVAQTGGRAETTPSCLCTAADCPFIASAETTKRAEYDSAH